VHTWGVYDAPRMRVALFTTCLVDALFPDAGKATVHLLERLGQPVEFPLEHACIARRADIGRVTEVRTTGAARQREDQGVQRALSLRDSANVQASSQFCGNILHTVDSQVDRPGQELLFQVSHPQRLVPYSREWNVRSTVRGGAHHHDFNREPGLASSEHCGA